MPDNPTRPATPWWANPIVLAAAATLVNAAKPVVVDDTVYLAFARQIAANPLDPYGFDLFWYREPEPAMGILAPPVLLYWLGAGTRLFGEHVLLLKLWLFPFPLMFAYATRFFLTRFARGPDTVLLPAIVLGSGVLPFLNFMLDVPALALELAAVALLVHATDGRASVVVATAAGICAGLAVQTKYSALVLPAVFVWYGVTHRRLSAAAVAVASGVAVFTAWEAFLVARYGVSHFVYHVIDQAGAIGTTGTVKSTGWQRVGDVFGEKAALFWPLLGFLGATTWWVGPLAWGLFGGARRLLRLVVGFGLLVFAALLVLPGRWVVVVPGPYEWADQVTVNGLLFAVSGGTALAAGVVASIDLTIRWPVRAGNATGRLRTSPANRFLVGWFLVELAGYFVLTPFPAGRRVIGVSYVLALVVGCSWSRVWQVSGGPAAESWVPAAAVVGGIVISAIDTLDAFPERELPRAAATIARDRVWPGTGYYVGHWGFQYYCEHVGMKPLLPDRVDLRPGDWVVVPVYPNESGFCRPYDGMVRFVWDESAVVPEEDIVWTDLLSAQTVPNLYGGKVPVLSRKYPRLRVVVYRVVKPWRPTAAPPA